jgi:hypothetical protein
LQTGFLQNACINSARAEEPNGLGFANNAIYCWGSLRDGQVRVGGKAFGIVNWHALAGVKLMQVCFCARSSFKSSKGSRTD